MRAFLTVAAIVGMLAFAPAAVAAERTAVLAVANMSCASCSYIVKKTMEGVSGVSSVNVSYGKKTATVIFDDARTTVDAIAQASTNTGFPAKPTR